MGTWDDVEKTAMRVRWEGASVARGGLICAYLGGGEGESHTRAERGKGESGEQPKKPRHIAHEWDGYQWSSIRSCIGFRASIVDAKNLFRSMGGWHPLALQKVEVAETREGCEVHIVTFVTFCYLLDRGQDVIEACTERKMCWDKEGYKGYRSDTIYFDYRFFEGMRWIFWERHNLGKKGHKMRWGSELARNV